MSNFIKKFIKKTLRSFHWNLVRWDINTSDELVLAATVKHFNIQTIIDGGANTGQYAAQLLETGYGGKIYSFEPISAVYDVLLKRSVRYPQWEVFKLGLGSKEEELSINVSENLVSSSLLKVGAQSLSAEPTTRTMRQEKIKITTVDAFLTNKYKLQTEALLKLDVQGYEMEALKGAMKSLPSFKVVQAELSFVPVYEGAPLFNEMVTFFEDNGFELYSLAPVFSDSKTGRLLQADGTFVRKQ